MTNNEAVAADELRIMVEMGDDFTPSSELVTALDDLRSVLEAESGDVSGFGWDEGVAAIQSPVRSFSFSMSYQKVEYGYTENDSKGKKVI